MSPELLVSADFKLKKLKTSPNIVKVLPAPVMP
jgi:hypothetical protein